MNKCAKKTAGTKEIFNQLVLFDEAIPNRLVEAIALKSVIMMMVEALLPKAFRLLGETRTTLVNAEGKEIGGYEEFFPMAVSPDGQMMARLKNAETLELLEVVDQYPCGEVKANGGTEFMGEIVFTPDSSTVMTTVKKDGEYYLYEETLNNFEDQKIKTVLPFSTLRDLGHSFGALLPLDGNGDRVFFNDFYNGRLSEIGRYDRNFYGVYVHPEDFSSGFVKEILPISEYFVFTFHSNGQIHLWNVEEERYLTRLRMGDVNYPEMNIYAGAHIYAPPLSHKFLDVLTIECKTIMRRTVHNPKSAVFKLPIKVVDFAGDVYNENFFCLAGTDGSCYSWDAESGKLKKIFQGNPKNLIRKIKYISGRLFIGLADGRIIIYEKE